MSEFPEMVAAELARAREKNAKFNSLHEGYAVLLEEIDELWDEIKRKSSERNSLKVIEEVTQVAAMAQRLAEDCLLSDDYDDTECWLCVCGNYITNGLHCPVCGLEPPWGCPCSECQNPDDYDPEMDFGLEIDPYAIEPYEDEPCEEERS
jgi:hypothetical protein